MNMGKLGILELKDQSYRDLSGGQQQRVLLARALCAARSLLILDEPITGLDPAAAQDLYKTLSYLNRKEGMAVVMVTHDLKAALRSARTVLHIGRSSYFLGTVDRLSGLPPGAAVPGGGGMSLTLDALLSLHAAGPDRRDAGEPLRRAAGGLPGTEAVLHDRRRPQPRLLRRPGHRRGPGVHAPLLLHPRGDPGGVLPAAAGQPIPAGTATRPLPS